MNYLDFFGSRRGYINYNPVPSFSSLPVSRFYGLFKPKNITVNYNYPVTVKDEINNLDYNVFFDARDEISLDSKISVNTIPTNQSLRDLIYSGNSNIEVIVFRCIISGYELIKDNPPNPSVENTTSYLVENGKLNRDYGKPCVRSLGNGAGYVNSMVSEINGNTNNFSISSSASPFDSEINVLFSTHYTSFNGLRYNHEFKNERDEDLFYVQNNGVRRTIGWDPNLPRNINNNASVSINKTGNLIELYNNSILQGTSFVDSRPPGGDRTMLFAFYNPGRGYFGYFRYLAIYDQSLNQNQYQIINQNINQYLAI